MTTRSRWVGTNAGEATWAITKGLSSSGVLSMGGADGILKITNATNDGEVMRISGASAFREPIPTVEPLSSPTGKIDRLPVRKAHTSGLSNLKMRVEHFGEVRGL
ncbi:MAG: hypothetical protein R3B47_18810 [Bacteroidia bacterium]